VRLTMIKGWGAECAFCFKDLRVRCFHFIYVLLGAFVPVVVHSHAVTSLVCSQPPFRDSFHLFLLLSAYSGSSSVYKPLNNLKLNTIYCAPEYISLTSTFALGGRVLFGAVCALTAVTDAYRLQKWSKGKVKEKLANLVLFDKITYDKMLADVPKLKLITPSIISEKLKVNGSLARKAVRELMSQNLIRPILTHKHQHVYTRATNQ